MRTLKQIKELHALIMTITISSNLIGALIMTITILSNLFGKLTALFFTNYCAKFKSDSEIGQLAVIGQLHLPIISRTLSLIH